MAGSGADPKGAHIFRLEAFSVFPPSWRKRGRFASSLLFRVLLLVTVLLVASKLTGVPSRWAQNRTALGVVSRRPKDPRLIHLSDSARAEAIGDTYDEEEDDEEDDFRDVTAGATQRRSYLEMTVGRQNDTVKLQGGRGQVYEENATLLRSDSSGGRLGTAAICLSGSAEFLELTGLSIIHNLLRAYPGADLFINSALDHHTHKLTVFNLLERAQHREEWGESDGPPIRLAAVRILERIFFTEGFLAMAGNVLAPGTGLESVLRELSFVEGCSRLIKRHERRAGQVYDQIVWGRLDGFWSARVRPFENPSEINGYVVPLGSAYGGHNADFGYGRSQASHTAMCRLSALNQLRKDGLRHLNSQRALKAHAERRGIVVSEITIPFCRISSRHVSYPLHRWAVPVLSMSSAGNLSGALCRPCNFRLEKQASEDGSEAARHALQMLDRGWGWPGPDVEEPHLCDTSEGDVQDPDWNDLFEEAAGKSAGQVRRLLEERGFGRCKMDWEELKRWVGSSWTGPEADNVCSRGALGELRWLGKPPFSYGVYLKLLRPSSIVYSFGVGSDISWETEVFRLTGAEMHTFDSTPWGMGYIDMILPLPPRFFHHENLLGIDDRCLDMWMLVSEKYDGVTYAHVSAKTSNPLALNSLRGAETNPRGQAKIEDELCLTVPEDWMIWGNEPVRLQSWPLHELMTGLKHERGIDVLKLSVEGMEMHVVNNWFVRHRAGIGGPPPVCQLLIEFAAEYDSDAMDGAHGVVDTASRRLAQMGFTLGGCDGLTKESRPEESWGRRCTFYSLEFCNKRLV